jgi:hypothetical protein
MEVSVFFFVVALVLGGVGVTVLLLYAKQLKPRTGPRPIWHYLLLWPLILERDKRNQNSWGRMLSTRETIGWIAVVLLIVIALVFKL